MCLTMLTLRIDRYKYVHFCHLRMTTCNISCLGQWTSQLPEDGHIMWPKYEGAENNTFGQRNGSGWLCVLYVWGVDENCAVLGYYTASSGKFLSTFRHMWVRNYHYSIRCNAKEDSLRNVFFCALLSHLNIQNQLQLIWFFF